MLTVTEVAALLRFDAATAPIIIGTSGETALKLFVDAKFPGCAHLDTRYIRKGGDAGYDVLASGLRIQVKTRRKGGGPHNLLKRVDAYGREIPINADCLCFAQIKNDSFTMVDLIGWAWKREALKLPLVRGIGNWFNVDIPEHWLLPMSALLDEIACRRELSDGSD